MTLTSAPVPTEDPERPEPPFPSALVEEMILLLVKALRAHQLYLHNNPTYLRALDVARAAFTPIWAETDELVFEVTETALNWEGVAVLSEPEKASDSLPWILYKDGVRELTLLKDFEQHELVPLLNILQRVRRASPEEDDLLTLLWEHEFAHLRYRYIDLTAEGANPLERAGGAQPKAVDPHAPAEPSIDTLMPGIVNLEDFDATLYFLDESEINYLQEEVKKEYSRDLRQVVVSALLDVFELENSQPVRAEIVAVLDTLMLHLLSAGEFRGVAYMLREGAASAKRAYDLSPEQRKHLLALPNRLSEPDVLAQVLQSLDEAADLPAQEDLNELFEQLQVISLGTVFAWLGRLQTPRLRLLLENAAARLASQHTSELVRLIGSTDRGVALEAIRRAGALRATAAVAALAKLLADPDLTLRLAAAQALGEIGSPGAMQLLERTVDDPHRDVRVATIRALATRSHRTALPKLEAAIKGKSVRETDLTERIAVFEAYGTMCGDAGIPLLEGMLLGKGLFGRREEPELRACAAMALGRIGSEGALAVLRRASNEKELLVRNAVNRALRGGGQ